MTATTNRMRGRGFEATLAVLMGAATFASLYVLGISGLGAAIVGVGLMLLTLIIPETATLAVIFVLYMNAAAVAVRDHGVSSAAGMGFFLLLLFPVIYYVVLRREPVRGDAVLVLLLAYGAVMVASAAYSHNPDDSMRALRTYLFEGMCLYFPLTNAVRTPATLRRAVWTVLLASSLLSAIALHQNLSHNYYKNYGGFAETMTLEQGGVRNNNIADMGKQELDEWGKPINRHRALGPVGDPNYFAQILTAALPLAVILLLTVKQRLQRLAAAGACVLLLGAIGLTLSRGAFVVIFFLGVFLMMLHYVRLRYGVILVALMVLTVALTPALRQRLMMSGVGGNRADISIRYRMAIARAALEVFIDHPLLGIGAGQSRSYLGAYSITTGAMMLPGDIAAHNIFLEQLVDNGILGFGCFAAVMIVLLRKLWRARQRWLRERPELAHLVTGLGLSLLMFLLTSMFLHLSYMRYLAVLLGLCSAAALISDNESVAEAAPLPAPVPQRLTRSPRPVRALGRYRTGVP